MSTVDGTRPSERLATARIRTRGPRATPRPVSQELVTDPDRFGALSEPWNRLAGDSMFLSWDWLDCWWRSFGQGAEMRVHLSWEGSELAGGIALGLRGRLLFGMAGGQTDLFRPVMRSQRGLDEALEPITSGPWSRIMLRKLPTGDPAAERVADMLRAQGWFVHRAVDEICPIVDTSGSFDDYLRSRSRNARKQLGRSRKRLADEGRIELSVVEPVSDLGTVLAESFALEADGWKGRSGKAIVSNEPRMWFWGAVFERYHRLGMLRFSELRLDGSLIAMSLDVLYQGRLYLLKTGYDERYASFSPGHLLYLEMIKRSCEDGIAAHELLGPTTPFKERYATETRQTSVLRAYRRRPAGVARYGGRRFVLPRVRPAYDRVRGSLKR